MEPARTGSGWAAGARRHLHPSAPLRRHDGYADAEPSDAGLSGQPICDAVGRQIRLQYHVEDTLRLLDERLVLNDGWKSVSVVNRAIMLPDTILPLATGRIAARDLFQPQAGLVFKLTPTAEVFADYSENMRAFVSCSPLRTAPALSAIPRRSRSALFTPTGTARRSRPKPQLNGPVQRAVAEQRVRTPSLSG